MDLFDNLSNASSLGIAFDQHYRQTFVESIKGFGEEYSITSPINISEVYRVGQIIHDAYQYQVLTHKLRQLSCKLKKSKNGKRSTAIQKKIKKWSTQFKPLHKSPTNFTSHSLARLFQPEPKSIDANLKPNLVQIREQLNKLKQDLASIEKLKDEIRLIKLVNREDKDVRTSREEELAEELHIKSMRLDQLEDSYLNDRIVLDQLVLTINRLEEDLLLKTEEHRASVVLLENTERLLDQIEESLLE